MVYRRICGIGFPITYYHCLRYCCRIFVAVLHCDVGCSLAPAKGCGRKLLAVGFHPFRAALPSLPHCCRWDSIRS